MADPVAYTAQDIINRDADWAALEALRVADEAAMYLDIKDARDHGNSKEKALGKRILMLRDRPEPARTTDWATDHNWTWDRVTRTWTAPS